jgi:hypothetical protein
MGTMEETKVASTSVITPEFRVSYPNVLKARKNDLNGKEEYSVMAIFSKSADLSALKAAAVAAMEKKFGKDKKAWPKQYRTPFRDQADRGKEDDNGNLVLPDGFEAGAIYLNLKSKDKPAVMDQRVKPITEEKDFYAGCFAKARINASAYDQAGNKGVSFYLSHIQKTKEGAPLGNRTRPEDDFKPIEGFEAGGPESDPNDLLGSL